MKRPIEYLVLLLLVASLLEACGGGKSSGRIDPSSLTGRIAFSGGPPHAEDVYVIHADGSGLRRITHDSGADFDPTWSPNGTRIAYRHQSGDDATSDIYVISARGSRARDLTPNTGVADWGPAWSPSGAEIAWNSDRQTPGTFRGYLMTPDGTDVRPLSANVWVEYPAWSPDGSKLAFMGQTPPGTGNYEIYVSDRDGSRLERLTHSPGSDGWPAWSPDGREILFAQIADWSPDGRYIVFQGRDGLGVVRADGTGMTTLRTVVPASGFPDWSR